jgi:glycosyltransferase involved in cell wall biosynthesis
MIRVVHLITGLDLGGAELSLGNVVARFDKARFESKVVSLIEPGPAASLIRNHGIPLVSLGLERGKPGLRGFARMVALLRRDRPAILQTWMYHADLLGLIAGRIAGTPRIVWNIRCSNMTASDQDGHLRLLLRLLAPLSSRPDAVVVNSNAGRRVHSELGYRPRRWVEIVNGVDTERYRPRPKERQVLRRALGIPEHAQVIGMVARLHAMKDHHTFLAAAAELAGRRPETFFVIAGKGCEPGSSELMQAITALGLEGRVRLLGARCDLEDVFPAFDLTALSSAFGEGFPNVLIESMACGVPCVATDVGDCARIIGHTGRVVPPRSPTALAAAWDEVLGADLEACGAAARARTVTFFDIDRARARYETLYSQLAFEAAPRAASLPALGR